VHIKIAKRLN